MKKLYHNTGMYALIIMLISAFTLSAQPMGNMQGQGMRGRKVWEKMSQIKKMKLLEILNLDEASADKFLAKYTAWENKIENQRQKIRNAFIDLHQSLQSEDKVNDIVKKTEIVTSLQDGMMKMIMDMRNDLKNVLDDVQYAKLIIFENNFKRNVGRLMMKRMKENKRGNRMNGGMNNMNR